MTVFRALSAALTIWASSPRAVRFLLAPGGVPQDLTGRSFVLAVRRAAMQEPIILINGVLSVDGMVYLFMLTSAQCDAIYDEARHTPLVYEVIETTYGGSTSRWSGPVDAQISSSLPPGEIPPAIIDLPAAEIVAETTNLLITERGATGEGVEKRFADKGLIPRADTDLMIDKIKEWGGEGGVPFAEAAQDAAQVAQQKAASATDDRERAEQAAISADALRGQVAVIAAGAAAYGTYKTVAEAQADPTLPVGRQFYVPSADGLGLDLYTKGATSATRETLQIPGAQVVTDVKVRTGFKAASIGGFDRGVGIADGKFYADTTPKLYFAAKIGRGAKSVSGGRVIDIGDPVEQRFGPTDDFLTGVPITIPVAGTVTGMVRPQIWVPRTTAVMAPVTGGPYPATLITGGNGLAFIMRRGAKQRARWRTVTLWSNAGLQMILVLIWGQSLAQGYAESNATRIGPTWRDNVGERAWQFDGRAIDGLERGPRPFQLMPEGSNKDNVIDPVQLQRIVPMRGAGHMGNRVFAQTSAESCALSLIGQHLHPLSNVLGCIVGTGGTKLIDFTPAEYQKDVSGNLVLDGNGNPILIRAASEHYQSLEAVIDAAKAQADRLGLTLNVVSVSNQGEADNGSTSAATWKSYWQSITDGLKAKTQALSANWLGAIIQQTEQRPNGNTGMSTLAQADIIRAGLAVGVPVYPMLPGHDLDTHLLPETYFPLGAATAYAIGRLVDTAGIYSEPFVPNGAAILTTGTTTTVTFSGGSGAMKFDTKTIPDMADGWKGVSLVDDNGPVAITGLTISGATLTITHAATGLPLHPKVRFGLVGSINPPPDAAGARINIRDDSEWLCPVTGQIVSGWPIQQEIALV